MVHLSDYEEPQVPSSCETVPALSFPHCSLQSCPQLAQAEPRLLEFAETLSFLPSAGSLIDSNIGL